jgi:hypothetical protein
VGPIARHSIASAYVICTGIQCDGYAGDIVLARGSPPLYACNYSIAWQADTPGCIPNLGGFTSILWAYFFAWTKVGADYIATATLATWQSFGGFGGGVVTLATWQANFGTTRPSCNPADLALPLTYSHPSFCTPPATDATISA